MRDALLAVAKFEKVARQTSEWFGGVDTHHIFFEGMHKDKDGCYSVYWGS